MTTNIKSRYARLRQVAVLPLMLALVIAFGTTARAAQEQDGDKDNTLLMTLIENKKNPIILVDGKVVESVEDVDNNMIASITIFNKKTKLLATLLEGTSISEEDILEKSVISIQMVKPENFVKVGEEALYKGVILNYDEEPVAGAVIKIGERGVVTDKNGRFEMRATRGEMGEIMMVGYMKQAMHFGNNADMEVRISKSEENKTSETITIKADKSENGSVVYANIDNSGNSGNLQQGKATVYSIKDGEAKKISSDAMATVIKAEQMPTFQGGGLEDFRLWVMTQVRFPKEMTDKGVTGRVVATFVVDTDGSVSNVDILQTPDKAFSDEVIRVLMSSPKWQAGMQDGKAVKVKYTIPIHFANYGQSEEQGLQEKPLEPSPTTANEVVVMSYDAQKR